MNPFQTLAEWRAVADVFALGFGFGVVTAGLAVFSIAWIIDRKGGNPR